MAQQPIQKNIYVPKIELWLRSKEYRDDRQMLVGLCSREELVTKPAWQSVRRLTIYMNERVNYVDT